MTDLLPPNATPVERNAAATGAALQAIPIPTRDIKSAQACPVSLLPFLAWERSVDQWDPDWPEATKRAVIEASFLVHQRKGTAGAVRQAVEAMGYRIRITRWYDMTPPGPRGTFAIELDLLDKGITDADFSELERQIANTKPLSRHLTSLNVRTETRGAVRIGGVPVLGDVITVYPRAPGPITVTGAVAHGGALHIIDTITVTAKPSAQPK